ncbi:MAG: DUF5660 domain-containing protein [Patescibacteria group bacterium]|nr:DUF5660 domain-containing protein [Patescibacteria group bacterium]
MAQRKFKSQANIDQNPIEAVRDTFMSLGSSVKDSVKDDVVKGVVGDILEQTLSWDKMLGTDVAERGKGETSGDLVQGQEISLNKKRSDQKTEKPHEERKPHIEAGWDYAGEIIRSEQRFAQAENRELSAKVSEIIIELKKLAKSSKELEVTFREITVEQKPVNPGKYHLNFFTWMLATIRSARMRVEDSKNWASLFASKKTKREYWGLFKKHGTSFGLSGERVVATQTG